MRFPLWPNFFAVAARFPALSIRLYFSYSPRKPARLFYAPATEIDFAGLRVDDSTPRWPDFYNIFHGLSYR